MLKIHFVCTGNIYRSRLAEAYLNSQKIPNLSVSSSGIAAGEGSDETIAWYALEIIKQNNLEHFMSPSWQKTSEPLLKDASLVIFMTQYHYDYCVQRLNFQSENYQIWGIEDMTTEVLSQGRTVTLKVAEGTFSLLKNKIDDWAKTYTL